MRQLNKRETTIQKSEPQHGQTQHQPAAKQGGGLALASPQGEHIAQLEAVMDSSPQAEKLGALSAMMNAGPAMAAQRKLMDNIHSSPHQAAQQKKFGHLFGAAQRVEDEEPVQGKFASPAQLEQQPAENKPNNTGLPDNLKSGIENLSGVSMDNVKVHYNSSQPAQLNALAYAQGSDIHVAPGQERHLPHEAWHVVQQAQGRVRPTLQMKIGVPVNDDTGLEHEADVMGGKALSAGQQAAQRVKAGKENSSAAGSVHAFAPGSSTNTLLDFPVIRKADNFAIQRVLTLDNGDFSEVNEIKKIGGAAEGAYLVSDGSGRVVLKIDTGIDSAVMAYNLAKDFGVKTPKGRYLALDNPSGEMLKVKVKALCPDLVAELAKASAVTLWSFVQGDTLDRFKNKGEDDEATASFAKDKTNFLELGRMLVFDAAILNGDRFKVEFGGHTNAGNVMVENSKPVGIDQDFAKVEKDSTPNEQIGGYGGTFAEKLKPLLANPKLFAAALCKKLCGEGFNLFQGKEDAVEEGILQGIQILRRLLDTRNPRLENLVAWAKTFKPDTDLDIDGIRSYWQSLLP